MTILRIEKYKTPQERLEILNNLDINEQIIQEEFGIDEHILYIDNISIPSLQDIEQQVVSKIREQYDINAEFKMINLGIADSTNVEYITYRQYVEDCKEWGRLEKIKYGFIEE